MSLLKRKVVLTCLLHASLLLPPAQTWAAAVPAGTALQGAAAGYVHLAQVRGDPAEESSGSRSTGAGGIGDRGDISSTGTAGTVGSASVSDSVTSSIVSQISISSAACQAVGTAYRTDCLAKELQALVKKLPVRGEYAAAREALAKASADLASLSRQNRDNSQPRLQITVQSDSETVRRPVAAVKPEIAAATNAKALAILDETTTVLLRSAEGSSDVAIHYQRIAQALNSSKVLLRS